MYFQCYNKRICLYQKKSQFSYSRLYLYYYQRKSTKTINEDTGSSVANGLRALCQYGVCAERNHPYSLPFNKEPSYCAKLNGSMNKIKKFKFVSPKDFKRTLIDYEVPIITGLYLPESFESGDEEIDYEDPVISTSKGHCVLVYGWEKDHYLAKNSWADMPWLRIPFKYNQFSDSWALIE